MSRSRVVPMAPHHTPLLFPVTSDQEDHKLSSPFKQRNKILKGNAGFCGILPASLNFLCKLSQPKRALLGVQ